jgi:excisionase family DNA binding protein
MTKLLTVNEAAEVLSLTPTTIYRMTKAGALPHVRIGRSIRFSEEDLKSLFKEAEPKREAPAPAAPVIKL